MATRECDCKEFQDSGHTDECNQHYKPETVRYHKDVATRLRRLADNYDRLASGSLKPHTDEIKPTEVMAKSLIRELVEWI